MFSIGVRGLVRGRDLKGRADGAVIEPYAGAADCLSWLQPNGKGRNAEKIEID